MAIACLPACAMAQGFEDEEDVPDTVPVDGGITMLAAAGVAYGAKRLRDRNNKKRNIPFNTGTDAGDHSA